MGVQGLTVVQTDQHGLILSPYHDGTLEGIHFGGEHVRIYYRCSLGTMRVVHLDHVHAMDVSGLRRSDGIGSMFRVLPHAALKVIDPAALERLTLEGGVAIPGRFIFHLDTHDGGEVVANCDEVFVGFADVVF